jgi:chromosome segregation ATPase
MLHFLRYGATMPTMAPPEDATAERFARLDERFDRTDERILDVDRRVAETAKETDRRLKEVDRRITEKAEGTDHHLEWIEEEVRGLRKGMQSLHSGVHRATIAIWVASAGVIAAILAKGC